MFPRRFFKKLKRGPQVVLGKDAGAVLAYSGLSSGDVVLEAGAGSGFAAIIWGNAVRPKGKVYSFERREDFADLAQKNVEKAGLEKVVKIVRKEAFQGQRSKADLVFLDCGDSNLLIAEAFEHLKPGGLLVGYLPHVEQLRGFVECAVNAGFELELCLENNEREWLVRERGSLPVNTGLTHTAFLAFLRKP